MSHWRDLLMLNTLCTPVGNMRIFIRIGIGILHVVQFADLQSADPHYTRSPFSRLSHPTKS